MCNQHHGASPHFSQVVRQYLKHKFPNRWIGRGGAPNWPPRSPDHITLDYHVWGYMKAMVYAQKFNKTKALFQRILSAARSINNAAFLRKVTNSLVTQVRKRTQADGRHFEQFAWVLNGESVIVHLTTCFNKFTMLPFPFWFVNCIIKIYNMCIWRFWLRISSGIKSRSSDLTFWDNCIYIYIYNIYRHLYYIYIIYTDTYIIYINLDLLLQPVPVAARSKA